MAYLEISIVRLEDDDASLCHVVADVNVVDDVGRLTEKS